jgi:hypothetical protein
MRKLLNGCRSDCSVDNAWPHRGLTGRHRSDIARMPAGCHVAARVDDCSLLDGERHQSRELAQTLPVETRGDKRQADGDDEPGLTEHCTQSRSNPVGAFAR